MTHKASRNSAPTSRYQKLALGGLALGCFIAVGAINCSSQGPGSHHVIKKSDKQRIVEPRVDHDRLVEQIDQNTVFALDLYHQLRSGPGANLFYSPHSVSTAFAMLQAGARGNTAKELAKALRFDALSEAELHASFNKLDLELEGRAAGHEGADGGEMRLSVANALWGHRTINFAPTFLDSLALNYGAGMHVLDFEADPDAAREEINAWVEARTEDRIKDLLPEGSVNKGTKLVLTNAVYFNAAWDSPFDKHNTQPRTFHAPSGDVQVPMMSGEQADARYAAGEDYEAVDVPYDGKLLSMTVVLPRKGTDLQTFDEGLSAAKLGQIIGGLQQTKVDLTLPKLKLDTKYSLVQALQALGVKDAFSFGIADFSGIGDNFVGHIGKVIHQAFVQINEEGTEAAAATAITMDGGVSALPPERVTVVVDRPYLFVIRDRRTRAVLFVGRVTEPRI